MTPPAMSDSPDSLNPLLTLCLPPHPDEGEMFERFARIGVGHGLPFDSGSLSEDRRKALAHGVDSARTLMTEAAESVGVNINGWSPWIRSAIANSLATTT